MRFVLLLFVCCTSMLKAEQPIVLVSIPAYKKVVQELVGEGVMVESVIPPGISFHTYEARPKDIEKAFSARVWFYIGDPFEDKIIEALRSHQSPIAFVDVRKGLSLICHGSCGKGADPHIWLDPRMMKIQLKTITEGLKQQFPEKAQEVERRFEELSLKMDTLISSVDGLLGNVKGKSVLVAHGAYGYLCREYGFNQLSLEKEGKEPSLASFSSLIKKAQALHIKTVFSLKQYPKIGIERVADILGAKIVDLDPYTEEYFENMLTTAEQFHEAMNDQSIN